MRTILVLCAGNIGRSPLAAVLLEDALAKRLGVPPGELGGVGIEITSAGTDAPAGWGASRRGIAFAAERGVDLSHHSATQLSAVAVRDADLIFAMDQDQLDAVKALHADAAAKTSLLAVEGCEIPDPRYRDDDFFDAVALQIEMAVVARADEIAAVVASERTPR